MKTKLLILLTCAVLVACDSADGDRACVDLAATGTAFLSAPVMIPGVLGEGDPIVGGGAAPADVQLGPYQGVLSSVVIEESFDEAGVGHFTLVHYFEESGTGHAFWTNDEAVCTPVSPDPPTCQIVTNMEVVGGTGKFAGLEGSIVNEGTLTITDPTMQTMPFGELNFNLQGEICGDGL